MNMAASSRVLLCSCVLAVRLGELLGMSGAELREVYYQTLLRYIGCNAQPYEMAEAFGEIVHDGYVGHFASHP